MPRKKDPNKSIFGAQIPNELKGKIDASLEKSRIPIGYMIEKLAEFCADMTVEEQRQFCYGTEFKSLQGYIDSRINAQLKAAGIVARAKERAKRLRSESLRKT